MKHTFKHHILQFLSVLLLVGLGFIMFSGDTDAQTKPSATNPDADVRNTNPYSYNYLKKSMFIGPKAGHENSGLDSYDNRYIRPGDKQEGYTCWAKNSQAYTDTGLYQFSMSRFGDNNGNEALFETQLMNQCVGDRKLIEYEIFAGPEYSASNHPSHTAIISQLISVPTQYEDDYFLRFKGWTTLGGYGHHNVGTRNQSSYIVAVRQDGSSGKWENTTNQNEVFIYKNVPLNNSTLTTDIRFDGLKMADDEDEFNRYRGYRDTIFGYDSINRRDYTMAAFNRTANYAYNDWADEVYQGRGDVTMIVKWRDGLARNNYRSMSVYPSITATEKTILEYDNLDSRVTMRPTYSGNSRAFARIFHSYVPLNAAGFNAMFPEATVYGYGKNFEFENVGFETRINLNELFDDYDSAYVYKLFLVNRVDDMIVATELHVPQGIRHWMAPQFNGGRLGFQGNQRGNDIRVMRTGVKTPKDHPLDFVPVGTEFSINRIVTNGNRFQPSLFNVTYDGMPLNITATDVSYAGDREGALLWFEPYPSLPPTEPPFLGDGSEHTVRHLTTGGGQLRLKRTGRLTNETTRYFNYTGRKNVKGYEFNELYFNDRDDYYIPVGVVNGLTQPSLVRDYLLEGAHSYDYHTQPSRFQTTAQNRTTFYYQKLRNHSFSVSYIDVDRPNRTLYTSNLIGNGIDDYVKGRASDILPNSNNYSFYRTLTPGYNMNIKNTLGTWGTFNNTGYRYKRVTSQRFTQDTPSNGVRTGTISGSDSGTTLVYPGPYDQHWVIEYKRQPRVKIEYVDTTGREIRNPAYIHQFDIGQTFRENNFCLSNRAYQTNLGLSGNNCVVNTIDSRNGLYSSMPHNEYTRINTTPKVVSNLQRDMVVQIEFDRAPRLYNLIELHRTTDNRTLRLKSNNTIAEYYTPFTNYGTIMRMSGYKFNELYLSNRNEYFLPVGVVNSNARYPANGLNPVGRLNGYTFNFRTAPSLSVSQRTLMFYYEQLYNNRFQVHYVDVDNGNSRLHTFPLAGNGIQRYINGETTNILPSANNYEFYRTQTPEYRIWMENELRPNGARNNTNRLYKRVMNQRFTQYRPTGNVTSTLPGSTTQVNVHPGHNSRTWNIQYELMPRVTIQFRDAENGRLIRSSVTNDMEAKNARFDERTFCLADRSNYQSLMGLSGNNCIVEILNSSNGLYSYLPSNEYHRLDLAPEVISRVANDTTIILQFVDRPPVDKPDIYDGDEDEPSIDINPPTPNRPPSYPGDPNNPIEGPEDSDDWLGDSNNRLEVGMGWRLTENDIIAHFNVSMPSDLHADTRSERIAHRISETNSALTNSMLIPYGTGHESSQTISIDDEEDTTLYQYIDTLDEKVDEAYQKARITYDYTNAFEYDSRCILGIDARCFTWEAIESSATPYWGTNLGDTVPSRSGGTLTTLGRINANISLDVDPPYEMEIEAPEIDGDAFEEIDEELLIGRELFNVKLGVGDRHAPGQRIYGVLGYIDGRTVVRNMNFTHRHYTVVGIKNNGLTTVSLDTDNPAVHDYHENITIQPSFIGTLESQGAVHVLDRFEYVSEFNEALPEYYEATYDIENIDENLKGELSETPDGKYRVELKYDADEGQFVLGRAFGVSRKYGIQVASEETRDFPTQTQLRNALRSELRSTLTDFGYATNRDTLLEDMVFETSRYFLPIDSEDFVPNEEYVDTVTVERFGLNEISITYDKPYEFEQYLMGNVNDNPVFTGQPTATESVTYRTSKPYTRSQMETRANNLPERADKYNLFRTIDDVELRNEVQ